MIEHRPRQSNALVDVFHAQWVKDRRDTGSDHTVKAMILVKHPEALRGPRLGVAQLLEQLLGDGARRHPPDRLPRGRASASRDRPDAVLGVVCRVRVRRPAVDGIAIYRGFPASLPNGSRSSGFGNKKTVMQVLR